MAFGVTIVDVIIKNMSNKNIMSVIDDIENTSIVLVFLFNIIRALKLETVYSMLVSFGNSIVRLSVATACPGTL